MTYCTACLKECSVHRAVVSIIGYVNEREYGCKDVYGDVSDCCEAWVEVGEPPISGPHCDCGEPAVVECSCCKQPYCVDCFGGPEKVEHNDECFVCQIELAKQGAC
jgi:hypothetical protein